MTFKYTGPGYYVTRDGRKALVGEHGDYIIGFIVSPESNVFRWSKDGVYSYTNKPSCADLVGPWVEPPKPVEGWLGRFGNGKYHCYMGRPILYDTAAEALGAVWPNGEAIPMREVKE